MKKVFLFLTFIISLTLTAQTTYRTKIFQPDIKTLQIGVVGVKLGLPIMDLNSPNVLQLSFDQMSREAHSYGYKVIHCNADWTPSDLNSSEYLSGFTTGNITDYSTSFNTTYLYTHYSFLLPNNDMGFKISGNYVVIIYEDNQVTELQPTYFTNSKLSFINNKGLIFEGGNQYHRFDFSSVYAAGEGISSI